jgi:hypothetical protein
MEIYGTVDITSQLLIRQRINSHSSEKLPVYLDDLLQSNMMIYRKLLNYQGYKQNMEIYIYIWKRKIYENI